MDDDDGDNIMMMAMWQSFENRENADTNKNDGRGGNEAEESHSNLLLFSFYIIKKHIWMY